MGFFGKSILKKTQDAVTKSIDDAAEAVKDKANYYVKTKEGREEAGKNIKSAANEAKNVGEFVATGLYNGYKRKATDYASIANDVYHGRYVDAAETAAARCKRKVKMIEQIAGDGATVIGSGAKMAYGTASGKGYDKKDSSNFGNSLKKIVLVGTVVLAGAGVVEGLDHLDIDHLAEAHGLDDLHHDGVHITTEGTDALMTDHGIIPDFNVNDLPGIEHGMLVNDFYGTLEQIAHTGEVDGAQHIDDVVRSVGAKMDFLNMNGYLSEPEGFQIHHIVPLSEGGADTSNNMILLSEEDHEFITSMHRIFYGWNS